MAILEAILSGSVDADTVSKWLNNALQQEEVPEVIAQEECDRHAFVLELLNFLRRQTSIILSISESKQQCQVQNESTKQRTLSCQPPQKLRSPPHNPKSPPQNLVSHTKSTAPRQKSYTSPATFHSESSKRISPRTMNLGDFLIADTQSKRKGRKSAEHKRRIAPTPIVAKPAQEFGTVVKPNCNSFSVPEQDGNTLEDERELLRAKRQESNSLEPVNFQPVSIQTVEPQPEFVTLSNQLDALAAVYASCVNHCLVPSVTYELKLITQLTVARSITNCENQCELLGTVHNCVYFAVKTLYLTRYWLQYLDTANRHMLMLNERVDKFSPQLVTHLKNLPPAQPYVKDFGKCRSRVSVMFQSDTDNRENFLSDSSFRTFCKQRDLFYEILRQWEVNQQTSGWTFQGKLTIRIQSLVATFKDPVTVAHFARLFQTQLIKMAKEDLLPTSSDNISVPGIANTDKMKKLHERFVQPMKNVGESQTPTFPNSQEFFRDFLLVADCPLFNEHLQNSLISEILRLNGNQFNSLDGNSIETVDNETRMEYSSCLFTLCLLAKFLGYITYAPYRSSEEISEHVRISQCQLRQWSRPRLDILRILCIAYASQRMLLSIPWIVQYLAMTDAVGPELPYYKATLSLLLHIYQNLPCLCCESTANTPNSTVVFLRFTLGWLFEQVTFQFSKIMQDAVVTHIVKTQSDCSVCKDNSCVLSEINFKPMDQPLDSLQLIDTQLLYEFCPYLSELKLMLGNFRSAPLTRHITPVAASTENSQQRLEMQMEEHFFHNQPSSLKKTVDFVSERISSVAVKCAQKEKPELQEKTVKDLCKKHAFKVIPLLLPVDTAIPVVEMSCSIATRTSTFKALKWISTHPPVIASVCSSEPAKVKGVAHSLCDLAQDIKELIRDCLSGSALTSGEEVKAVLSKTDDFCSLNASADKTLALLTVDYAIVILVNQPEIMNSDVQKIFINFWTGKLKKDVVFTGLLSPRNMVLFGQSQDKQLTFDKLEQVIVQIIKADLLTVEEFQEQCMIVLRQTWPKDVQDRFATCLQGVLRSLKLPANDSTGDLIQWIAWYCAEAENFTGF